ncbi:MAG: diacylglycerol kinase family lipid kinase [Gemmatales bacterium]|nr:diacylglycerol kinase family lipid kinase [Gemmatales bacterium]MDW8385644.1 diacylglycerol kinase family lipid kinase [Gemmatales bacterium]
MIANPSAGRGRAGRILRRVLHILGKRAEYWITKEPGHAETLARQAVREGFSTVVAAGGDGTVHEIANGLLDENRQDVCLGVLPVGSGNDYAASLALPGNAERLAEIVSGPIVRRVDVGLVQCATGKRRWFVNTLGFCLSGAVVWETCHVRHLRGLALYAWGAIRAIWRHFRAPLTKIKFDDTQVTLPTLFLTVALGKREGGGFLVAPQAELDDGWFDYLHGSQISRLGALWYMPALALGRIPENDPAVRTGRCRRLEISAEEPFAIHADGEVFSGPQDRVCPLSVELRPRALPVKAFSRNQAP